MAAGVLDGGNDRLAGKQVVAKIDRSKMADRGAVPGQPGLRRVAFTVLLLGSIPWNDEFRPHEQNLFVTWSDQGSSQEREEIFRAAVRTAP
jgi:hypothetical protein